MVWLYLKTKGQSLVEIMVAIGIAAVMIPALLTGLIASREGKAQQLQRLEATHLMRQSEEEVRSVREGTAGLGWTAFAVDGTYHLVASGSAWALSPNPETINGYTRTVVIADVYRDSSGKIVTSGGAIDHSTKKVIVSVAWQTPIPSSVSSSAYLTRYMDNLTWIQTTAADFNTGILSNVVVTNTAGGEVQLSQNTRAKWCSPALSTATIDLPDGPPVAVSAFADPSSTANPNQVFVGVSPSDATSTKLAYVNVTANTDPPVPTLKGTFTLDPTKYSSPGLVPTGIGLDNNFKTNDVKYYKSTAGSMYALMATDLPTKEVVVVKINDGVNDTYQDPTNKIYKYWTSFNTRMYGSALNSPTANSADTGGDGDGYQTNPTNAYASDGVFAVDTNSGNGVSTSCAGIDKDRHRFYNYNFSVPTGATINGIEVDVAAKVDSVTGSPFICAQMSWDGGVTWTATQSTANLTTSLATYVLGGANNTWGRTWTDPNFTNTNFRLRLIDVASNNSRDFSLDWVGAKVYYNGGISSANDQAPFSYGATDLTISGNTGYIDSGGYLYTFDLSNIDTKSTSTELDQIGCRILLDGYNCQPNNGTDMKYAAGESGASWSDTTSPAHLSCSDGGNIELYADHQLSAVTVGANKYVYVAVGAGTNPELDIVDVSTAPSGANLSNASCGRGTNVGWKVTGTLDFDTASNTEEAANSVFAKSDGTRAYMSSNGGIIHNNIPDSDQFYIIDTTDKTNPKFLSVWPSTVANQHYINTASSGYYNGNSTNIQLYPRRALTVLNGARAVLVGQDGIPNDGIEPQEYQVLNLDNESTPTYCGGINFLPGFNDLTSVSEADGDNFVYMVANTNVNELKIIQGGPDGAYVASGNYESATFDAGYNTAFNRLSATVNQPANTLTQVQVAVANAVNNSCATSTFSYIGPDGTSSTFFNAVSATISAILPIGDYSTSYHNPARCFRYKTFLSTTDYNQTPTLYDNSVNYSP